jgi:hypothetical protein
MLEGVSRKFQVELIHDVFTLGERQLSQKVGQGYNCIVVSFFKFLKLKFFNGNIKKLPRKCLTLEISNICPRTVARKLCHFLKKTYTRTRIKNEKPCECHPFESFLYHRNHYFSSQFFFSTSISSKSIKNMNYI